MFLMLLLFMNLSCRVKYVRNWESVHNMSMVEENKLLPQGGYCNIHLLDIVFFTSDCFACYIFFLMCLETSFVVLQVWVQVHFLLLLIRWYWKYFKSLGYHYICKIFPYASRCAYGHPEVHKYACAPTQFYSYKCMSLLLELWAKCWTWVCVWRSSFSKCSHMVGVLRPLSVSTLRYWISV